MELTLLPLDRPSRFAVRAKLDCADMQSVDVVPMLARIASWIDGDDRRAGERFVVLSETFNNALDHGLLMLDSGIKADFDGIRKYHSSRHERLHALKSGAIEFYLEPCGEEDVPALKVQCKDTGAGYDVAQKLASLATADELLPYGRGLLMLHAMARSVSHNDAGNEVTVVL